MAEDKYEKWARGAQRALRDWDAKMQAKGDHGNAQARRELYTAWLETMEKAFPDPEQRKWAAKGVLQLSSLISIGTFEEANAGSHDQMIMNRLAVLMAGIAAGLSGYTDYPGGADLKRDELRDFAIRDEFLSEVSGQNKKLRRSIINLRENGGVSAVQAANALRDLAELEKYEQEYFRKPDAYDSVNVEILKIERSMRLAGILQGLGYTQEQIDKRLEEMGR